jgi:hypothetical protein
MMRWRARPLLGAGGPASGRDDWHTNGVTLAGAKGGASRRIAQDPGLRVASGRTTDMGTGSGPAGCAAYDPERSLIG